MKNLRSLLVALTALALGATAHAARTQQAVPLTNGDELVVSKLVNPSNLPRSFTRSVLNVRFALDEEGQPQNVRVVTMTDSAVKKQVVKAFKEWRFDVAALTSGIESKHYVLPLEIVPEK